MCFGPDCEGLGATPFSVCARRAASNPRYFYEYHQWEVFLDFFRTKLAPLTPVRISIGSSLSGYVHLATAYAPAPRIEGRTLLWEFDPPASTAVTVTYRVRALSAGTYPVSDATDAEVDFRRGSGPAVLKEVDFGLAIVDVTGSIFVPLLTQMR
jgi:hypothetical protein